MSQTKKTPNIFDTLPVEIMYIILDFMTVREYSGLPCTCRHALELVNSKVNQEFHWIRDQEGQQISASGKFIWHQKMEYYRREMVVSCYNCGWYPESDSDL